MSSHEAASTSSKRRSPLTVPYSTTNTLSDRNPPHEAQPPGRAIPSLAGIDTTNSRNISSLPHHFQEDKNEGISREFVDTEADIVGLSEINLAWQKVSHDDSLAQRFKSRLEASRFVSSTNTTDTPISTATQYGGTITGCIGTMTFRIHQ